MKAAVGPDYPIWPRINVCEYGVEDGITVEESRKVVPLAVKAGAQAIHASAYAAFSFITKAPLPDTASFLVPLAEEVKKVTDGAGDRRGPTGSGDRGEGPVGR